MAADHVDDLSISGNQWGDGGFVVSAVRGGGGKLAITGNTSANVGSRVVATVSGACTPGAEPGTDYVYFLRSGARVKLPAARGNTSRYTLKNIGERDALITAGDTVLTVRPGAVTEVVSDGTSWQSLR